MIFEIATIEIAEGQEATFERGVAEAVPLFRRARGYRSIRLDRSIETPLRYRLIVGRDSVEHHMDQFRSSEDFQEWRSLVGHTFAAPPEVEHTEVILAFD